jgi:hypothetical protein
MCRCCCVRSDAELDDHPRQCDTLKPEDPRSGPLRGTCDNGLPRPNADLDELLHTVIVSSSLNRHKTTPRKAKLHCFCQSKDRIRTAPAAERGRRMGFERLPA